MSEDTELVFGRDEDGGIVMLIRHPMMAEEDDGNGGLLPGCYLSRQDVAGVILALEGMLSD